MTNINDFKLIETILWEDGKYFLLDLHLKRLGASSRFFGFNYNHSTTEVALNNNAKHFSTSLTYKVRLLLEKEGKIIIESNAVDENLTLPAKVAFSSKRTNKDDVFLRHKTTNRKLYDTELKASRDRGFFDCIFLNEDDEVTEGCITNVVTRKGNEYFTPPASSGILPGVYREYLLSSKEISLIEKILYKDDILDADEIFLVNSVRKMIPASI